LSGHESRRVKKLDTVANHRSSHDGCCDGQPPPTSIVLFRLRVSLSPRQEGVCRVSRRLSSPNKRFLNPCTSASHPFPQPQSLHRASQDVPVLRTVLSPCTPQRVNSSIVYLLVSSLTLLNTVPRHAAFRFLRHTFLRYRMPISTAPAKITLLLSLDSLFGTSLASAFRTARHLPVPLFWFFFFSISPRFHSCYLQLALLGFLC
jgi:hypothetical protein